MPMRPTALQQRSGFPPETAIRSTYTCASAPHNTLTIWNSSAIKQKASFERLTLTPLTVSRVYAIDR